MHMQATGGAYPLASSEASYRAHSNLIDAVIVPNGGTLQPDGTWVQGEFDAFALDLLGLANRAGQRYVVCLDAGHNQGTDAFKVVLDSAERSQTAVDNALELALVSRHDSPWDGVMLDIPWLEDTWYARLHQFLYLFSYEVRRRGLSFEIAYPGIIQAHDPWTPSLDVFGQVADRFDLYVYSWWEEPRSLGPYWWARASIENALDHGVPANRVYLGIANYARYWPVTGKSDFHEISHDSAEALVRKHNGFWQWAEDHETGLLREWYADVGKGHIWKHDGATAWHRLRLVDEFGLAGVMVFCPGLGDGTIWNEIAEWKAA